MGVVKRNGKWRLKKKEKGVYIITERKEERAKIITGDYVPEGLSDERNSMMLDVIEVSDFREAKKEFKDYQDRSENSGGLF